MSSGLESVERGLSVLWVIFLEIALLALLSRGARRGGLSVLGGASIAVATPLVLAGIATWELEPNWGPYSHAISVVLTLMGTGFGAVCLVFGERFGAWFAEPRTAGALSLLSVVAFVLVLGAALTITLRSRGREAAEPELAPLVSDAARSGYGNGVSAGGVTVTVEARKLDSASYWPDRCFMVIVDELAHEKHEVDLGRADTMSGSTTCPASTRTIDPNRRVLYLEQPQLIGSTTRAWKFPGFYPTSTTVWTCRRGRLLAVPREWMACAWLSVALAGITTGIGIVARRRRTQRFAGAVEAGHEGHGMLSLRGGERLFSPAAADFPIGVVTVLHAGHSRSATYRTQAALDEATVIASSLDELTGPSRRVGAFVTVAAVGFALSGAAPLALAAVSLLR